MARHHIERLRHETRRRTLTVEKIVRLTPHVLRIGFRSDDLRDFVSLSADDNIKLFLPVDGGSAQMRTYTPRQFDTARGTLTIDFALHDTGLATRWALGASVGDRLEIGGPRGSAVVPADFDWYWLIGDETALPAISRWLEEARANTRITTFVIVESASDVQEIATAASWNSIWIIRNGGTDDAALLKLALASRKAPTGDGFVWIAAEAEVARAVRVHVLDDHAHPREWIKAAGYWTRGKADTHERMED